MIFDLDGTLIDSVYQHVSAWREALAKHYIAVAQWRIHRAIGMSGRLFLPKLLRDEGHRTSMALVRRLETAHAKRFNGMVPGIVATVESTEETIHGDSVWDVLAGRRMKASVVALRTGGFDGHELQESGAYRVYADPLELSESLEQLGFSAESSKR
jgi:phosphoglycolate phosphatase-like HAD superfamily hydrolase